MSFNSPVFDYWYCNFKSSGLRDGAKYQWIDIMLHKIMAMNILFHHKYYSNHIVLFDANTVALAK